MDRNEKQKKSWRERIVKTTHGCLLPLRLVERACEWFSKLLGRWAFLEIMGHLGRLAILVAVIFWILEFDDRKQAKEDQRKAKQYQAWQVINTAQGKPGNGGRTDALQDLLKDNVSLAGIDISKANLPNINLRNANLSRANLSEAILWDADLSGAYLFGANLSEASLWDADLSGANLSVADLSKASLFRTNLSGANLGDANLSEAYLKDTNLSEADLQGANLSKARFSGANLSEANLQGADLSKVSLFRTNLFGANLRKSKRRGDIELWNNIKNIKLANIYGADIDPNSRTWAIEHGAVSIESDDEWNDLLQKEKLKDKKAR